MHARGLSAGLRTKFIYTVVYMVAELCMVVTTHDYQIDNHYYTSTLGKNYCDFAQFHKKKISDDKLIGIVLLVHLCSE